MQSIVSTLRKPALLFLILFALIVAVYAKVLTVPLVSDDHLLRTFGRYGPHDLSFFAVNPTPWSPFHRPLVWLLWQLLDHFAGDDMRIYHAVSLLLHTANCLLIALLTFIMLPQRPVVGVYASILFALFPGHIEAIAWPSSYYDLLATACYLGTLCCLCSAWRSGRWAWYLCSLLIFQLGLWSKEPLFTFPAAVLLFATLLSPRPALPRLLASLLPYGLLIAINLLQRILVWGSIGGYEDVPLDYRQFPGAQLTHIALFFLAPVHQETVPAQLRYFLTAVTGLSVVGGFLVSKHRFYVSVLLVWSLLTLLPVLNLLPIPANLQGSRFFYLPAAGFCIALALLAAELAQALYAKRPALSSSLSIGLIAITYWCVAPLHIGPWAVAGQASQTIAQSLYGFIRQPRHASILHVVGLPDNYRGAYIYRLGIDATLLNRYGVLFNWWPVFTPQPIPYQQLDLQHDFYQFTLAPSEDGRSWAVQSARAVTSPATPPPLYTTHWIYKMHAERALTAKPHSGPLAQPAFGWDFTPCLAALLGWQLQNAAASCQQSAGLTLAPTTPDAHMLSPALQLSRSGWTEVVVEMQTICQQCENGLMQIFWQVDGQAGWSEQDSILIELPAQESHWVYHFYIPPSASGDTLGRIRLDPVNTATIIRLSRIEIYQLQ